MHLDADPERGVRLFGARGVRHQHRGSQRDGLARAVAVRANYIDAQAMLRRDAWQRHGGYRTDDELVFGWEDWELWLRFAAAGEHGVYVPQMLGRYRTQEVSMLSTTNLVADHMLAAPARAVSGSAVGVGVADGTGHRSDRSRPPLRCASMSSASELIARRELLWNLTLRELRGRYKRSILGWGWSLLNPIAFMLVYTFAFSLILRAVPPPGDPSGLSSYAFFLLCGLLPWTFFSVSVTTSMDSVVANAALVRKVAFPREHLIVSTVVAGLFTLGDRADGAVGGAAVAGNVVLVWIPLILLTSLLVAVFAAGVGLALAAANVYFRDLSYLWSIVVQALFFATPVVYPPQLVIDRLPFWVERIYQHMPMTVAVRIYRYLMYDLRMPRMLDLGTMAVYAGVGVVPGLVDLRPTRGPIRRGTLISRGSSCRRA